MGDSETADPSSSTLALSAANDAGDFKSEGRPWFGVLGWLLKVALAPLIPAGMSFVVRYFRLDNSHTAREIAWEVLWGAEVPFVSLTLAYEAYKGFASVRRSIPRRKALGWWHALLASAEAFAIIGALGVGGTLFEYYRTEATTRDNIVTVSQWLDRMPPCTQHAPGYVPFSERQAFIKWAHQAPAERHALLAPVKGLHSWIFWQATLLAGITLAAVVAQLLRVARGLADDD